MRNAEQRRASRDRHLQRKYGITADRFDEMLVAQGFRCLVCGDPAMGQINPWFLDHCHDTGAVRGILCPSCNTGLGLFKDDPKRLIAAAQYLVDSRTAVAS